MNNSWWQEFVRFFLQGMTLKQLVHMLIILIALVMISPASFKEWVNLHNPEIIPPYWMYYALLFCISYVLNSLLTSIYSYSCNRIEASRQMKLEKDKFHLLVSQLNPEELEIIKMFLSEKTDVQYLVPGNNPVSSLSMKGIIKKTGNSTFWDGKVVYQYSINTDYRDVLHNSAGCRPTSL